MPAVARANQGDKVFSPDGTGHKCRNPMTTATGVAGQSRVFCQGILVATLGDPVAPHPISGCGPDQQTLNQASSRVSAMGRRIGRIGDTYGNNTIISGSPRVFSN